MTKYKDFPFWEIAAEMDKLVKEGHMVFQKFSCSHCGQRLTMPEPNHAWISGTCDQCGLVTDIERQGCNFMLISGGGKAMEVLERAAKIAKENEEKGQ